MRHINNYRLLVLAGVCFVAVACRSSDKNAVANLQTAGDMFAAFNRHDWKAMAGYYIEAASFLDPSFGKGYVTKTRQQTIDKYAALQQMFPGIKDSIVNIFAFDEKVTVEFVSGDTGWRLPICTILTFKGGLITTDATYYDNSK